MASQILPRNQISLARIPILDGWRGIAILIVLVSHTLCVSVPGHLSYALSVGQHGVTLFFVISGFIITRRLLDEQRQTGSINLAAFYGRRAFRILPCSWMFLAVLAFIFWRAHLSSRIAELIPVLLFFRNYTDPTGSEYLTGHFWSLSIEEQFYLVWPTVLKIAGPRRAGWIAAAAALGIAAWRLHERAYLASVPLQTTFPTQFRADSLLLGCVAALCARVLHSRLRAWMAAPAAAVVLAGLVRTHLTIPIYESAAMAILLLVTCRFADLAIFTPLRSRVLVRIGVISYSLYVWQQICIFGLHRMIGIPLSLVFLFGAASLSYICVERPLIRCGSRWFRSRPRVLSPADTPVAPEPVILGETAAEG